MGFWCLGKVFGRREVRVEFYEVSGSCVGGGGGGDILG